ncbi:uncharacterized protein METZ01_LOCUS440864, partial [marine metagenome]
VPHIFSKGNKLFPVKMLIPHGAG